MIESARIPYRRKRRPVRYYSLTLVQGVLIFALLFYYVAMLTRSPHVRVQSVVIDGAHAVATDTLAVLAAGPLQDSYVKYLRKDNRVLYPYDFVHDKVMLSDRRIKEANLDISSKVLTLSIMEEEPAFRYCVPAVSASGTSELALPLQSTSTSGRIDPVSGTTTVGEMDLGADILRPLPVAAMPDLGTHACYWVNDDGIAFAKSPEYSGSPLLTFVEGDSSKFSGAASSTPDIIGTVVLSRNVLDYGVGLRHILSGRSISVYDYELLRDDDIRMRTSFDYPILVSMHIPAKQTGDAFFTALADFMKHPDDKPKEYLDLRFENKIFYK